VYPDQIIKVETGMVRPVGTPTLVIVSSEGRVERVWRGQLDSEGERSVVEHMMK
jgi:hypothetical protein